MQDRFICDLFIRSYWKDLEWLAFCLASIGKYCRGFRSVIVVLPQSSEPWLRRTGLLDGAGPSDTQIAFCRNYPDDYLGQQATKLLAGIMVRDGFDFRPTSTMWILLSLNSRRIASSNCSLPIPGLSGSFANSAGA